MMEIPPHLLWLLFLLPLTSPSDVEQPITTALPGVVDFPSAQPMVADNVAELEDEFIRIFGNQEESQFWDMARVWNLMHFEPLLKRYCHSAHKQARLIPQGTANFTAVKHKKLVFANPDYIPRGVDVVMYGINRYTWHRRERHYFWMHRDDCWYMTMGESDDCVFYVTHANKPRHEFKLVKHVCGIYINNTMVPWGHYY